MDLGTAEPVAPPRRRRRGRFQLGLVLVVAGLTLLGYVAWEVVGTNIVARHRQHQAIEQLERIWSQPPTDQHRVPGDVPALIRIPRFGKSYVMPVFEGVSDDVLAKGFGHFLGTAEPGGVGNFALAAHRVTHGEPLRNMPSLRPGDKIVVETRDRVDTYVIDTDPNSLVVSFRDTWVIDAQPANPVTGGVEPAAGQSKLITLTTCSELFHTSNRMVAFGHLVSSVAKSPA